MVKGKIFIVAIRESTAKGIWKSPGQREKEVDGTWPADWTWALDKQKCREMEKGALRESVGEKEE